MALHEQLSSHRNSAHYRVIVLLLAENEVELRVIMVRLVIFRSESYHNTILKEVVELGGCGV
jgi:hypothetical protein